MNEETIRMAAEELEAWDRIDSDIDRLCKKLAEGVVNVNPKDFIQVDPEAPIYSTQAWDKLRSAGNFRDKKNTIAFEHQLFNRELYSVLDDYLRKQIEAENAIIREALRRATECGVLIVRSTIGVLISCEPDQKVPKGEVHMYVDHSKWEPKSFWKD